MLADDTFRAELRRILTELRRWAGTLRDAARVEENEADTFFRLRVSPAADNACAFELILHEDQHYDLAVGPEVYERMPIERLALFPPLAEAIADARMTTRHWISRNTGALRSVETIIYLPDGRLWRRERLNMPLAAAIGVEECEAQDHEYAPYRLP